MKRINMRLITQENLAVDMTEDMADDAVFVELLQGQKEFIKIGSIAISKRHIAYVTIQEAEAAPQSSESAPTEVTEEQRADQQGIDSGSQPSVNPADV